MTAVTSGTSSTVTLTTQSTVTVVASGAGRAQVTVTLAGRVLYNAALSTTQNLGPFPPQSILTVAASGPGVSYNVQTFVPTGTGTTAPSIGQPASGTVFAVAASQASYGALIDAGPNQNVFLPNSGLFPVAFAPSSPVLLNSYRTPSIANGLIYKCTTAGTTAASEAAWGTTIGGTTTQGTAVFTAEKGPYFVDGSGVKCFRSLASAQTGQQSVHQMAAAPAWDMLNGDSFILNLRTKFDWNASGQGAASCIFSTSQSATGPGVRALATGATFQDIRFQVWGVSQNILSGNMAQGYVNSPFNGLEHNVTFMIDGILKMAYCFIDGIALNQAAMNSGSDLCPNGMNLAAITTSTAGGVPTIGGDPGLTTSVEVAMRTAQYIVLPGIGLPADIQSIASWFARGGEGVLPQLLVQ